MSEHNDNLNKSTPNSTPIATSSMTTTGPAMVRVPRLKASIIGDINGDAKAITQNAMASIVGLKDGESVTIAVSAKVTINNGVFEWDMSSKYSKSMSEKLESWSNTYDPNQPELPNMEGAE